MDLPVLTSYKKDAVECVTFVLNRAISMLGVHQTLMDLAHSTKEKKYLVSTSAITSPTVATSMKLIVSLIKNTWKLTRTLMFHIQYTGCSSDELSLYFYFEVIFSQPTPRYPIPQATVSVFFRVQEMQTVSAKNYMGQKLTFRIEGHYIDHDVRVTRLTEDWILALLKMKLKLFERIENMQLF